MEINGNIVTLQVKQKLIGKRKMRVNNYRYMII